MAPPLHASHKPRAKRKEVPLASTGATTLENGSKKEKPAFPLAAFLWPAKGTSVSQWVIVPSVLMCALLFRWCTGMWPYSGYEKPPMHGDFEAQRHWMELTVHLHMTHWYFHDLPWWGLDYPPLTAYHSWLLGRIGDLIEPRWFALYLSRGIDDLDLKVFMRATVVLSEYLIYTPATVLCVRQLAKVHNINGWDSAIALTAFMMQPATILIDHGHFQYNTVMLGFTVATIASMLAGRPLCSCVFFVSALGFKQMALFYAPAVAAYLAGTSLFPRTDPSRFLAIAAVTVSSFFLLFVPLLLGTAWDTFRGVPLPSDTTMPPLLSALPFQIPVKSGVYPFLLQVAQTVHRIFPFARGLFEDKVANIWCAIHSSGIHKLHSYDSGLLSKAALALTLASIAPPCLIIFIKPRKTLILYAFAATAWGFFLCSYQVHEKNVLLPLLPMTLMLATESGMKPTNRAWIGFANNLALWTLFPLLARDELRIPYFGLAMLWAFLMGLPPVFLDAYIAASGHENLNTFTKIVHLGTYAAMIAWHVVEFFVPPPMDKPDLWVVANVCIGCAGFGLCYLWCCWKLVDSSGLLQDFGIVKPKVTGDKKVQ